MMQSSNITGIVLAGGRSNRFGTNKAFAMFRGRRMVEYVLDAMSAVFSDVMIVTNAPLVYENLGYRVIKDLIPHKGPLGGIVTALKHFENIFVCGCDMPFITKTAIEKILSNAAGGFAAVVVKTGERIEPLFAVYNKSILPYFENSLRDGRASVAKALSEIADISYVDIEEKIVSSINTPEEMNAAI